MSGDPAHDKQRLVALLTELAAAVDPRTVLDRHCAPDCLWRIFHPFNDLRGTQAAADGFWAPLKTAFPDYEQRPALVLGGAYEGRNQVSSWGVVNGTFDTPWLGIPPTHRPATLRFGVNATLAGDRFVRIHILLDVVDLMRQAGVYPLRAMPGSAEAWAFPPADTGASGLGHDPAQGAETLRIVRAMQVGLPRPDQIATLSSQPSRHSPLWHPAMNWYGPAGIGWARGERGFRNVHSSLFLQAFPDRTGFPRADGADEDAPGHYIRLGDGNYAVTGGWPSLHATHVGGGWLGLPPTGRPVEMRVADWYRCDAAGLIIDNWVMIDVPHMLYQMGLDILHDLKWVVDPAQPRWPETA